MKKCIVVQGPDYEFLNICGHYNKQNTIFSTWEGGKNDPDGFPIVKQLMPGGIRAKYQIASTYAGCLKAKELGYDYVLKARHDLYFSEPDKVLSNLDANKFCFFTHVHHLHGYLSDWIIGGPIDGMIALFNPKDTVHKSFPEDTITKKYLEQNPDANIEFLLPLLIKEDISCVWLRHKKEKGPFDMRNLMKEDVYEPKNFFKKYE